MKRLQLLLIVPTFKKILRSTQELTSIVCFLKPSFKVFHLGLNLHVAVAGAPCSLQPSPRPHRQVQPPAPWTGESLDVWPRDRITPGTGDSQLYYFLICQVENYKYTLRSQGKCPSGWSEFISTVTMSCASGKAKPPMCRNRHEVCRLLPPTPGTISRRHDGFPSHFRLRQTHSPGGVRGVDHGQHLAAVSHHQTPWFLNLSF